MGGRDRIRVDVRVIAATNRDLSAAVTEGTFRQDLFYRLNVFPLEMPPLRERREDIPVLVEYFIGRYARKAGKKFRRVSKRTLDRLRSYPWPGNIRELQNVVERSVIVSDTDEFTVDESWLSGTSAVESRLGLSGTLASPRESDCRGGPAGKRRARRWTVRSGSTTWSSALDARIEDPDSWNQQEPLPRTGVKEILNGSRRGFRRCRNLADGSVASLLKTQSFRLDRQLRFERPRCSKSGVPMTRPLSC